MEESTIIMDHGAIARGQCESALETILREGGRRLLQEALELEVQQYIERFQQLKSESGQGLVVRNGYHQEREAGNQRWEGSGAPTARTRPQANGALHQCHPTTVSTAHAQYRRLDSGALPEGCFDLRLPGSAAGDPG